MLPSWIRSRNCRPRLVYFLAIEITRRRLASTISFLAWLASRSPSGPGRRCGGTRRSAGRCSLGDGGDVGADALDLVAVARDEIGPAARPSAAPRARASRGSSSWPTIVAEEALARRRRASVGEPQQLALEALQVLVDVEQLLRPGASTRLWLSETCCISSTMLGARLLVGAVELRHRSAVAPGSAASRSSCSSRRPR